MRNCAANAAHAARRVGRRVAPGSAAAVLSDRNDGQQRFSQPANIRANLRNPRKKILLSDALATKEPKELREYFFMIHVIFCG
jgi:hypothetical protein